MVPVSDSFREGAGDLCIAHSTRMMLNNLAFMRIAIAVAACSVISLYVGCSSSETYPRHGDSPEVIEAARKQVLAQTVELDQESREMIRTNAPRILYVGAPFGGQYTYQWTLTSNRFAELIHYGLDGFEGRPVRIRTPAPDYR